MTRPTATAPSIEASTSGILPVDELLFDPQNPRLAELGLSKNPSQREILEVLWQAMSVDEVAWSIAKNGFFQYEPLFVQVDNNNNYVIEGNRRLAAVKLLLDKKLRKELAATDLPTISEAAAAKLSRLPVIFSTRQDVWEYLGYKHVNGPAEWGPFSKAEYIAWVHNHLGVPLEEVAERIGDRHLTVQRLYCGWVLLEQAEKAKVWDRDDRTKSHFAFSHLYTGLGYDGFKQYLGITDTSLEERQPVPKGKLKNLGQLCVWLYGSKKLDQDPVIKSQNPDLRLLDEVLKSLPAIDALTSGLPLEVAHDVSQGDERIFRESLQRAKHYIQRARATLSTGYAGETDLLQTADAIFRTVEDLCEDMRNKQRPRRRPRDKGPAAHE
jgi:hypothetical protein